MKLADLLSSMIASGADLAAIRLWSRRLAGTMASAISVDVNSRPRVSLAVSLAAYSFSATTWLTLFNPTGSDVVGFPPSTSSGLIISEIEP